MLSMVYVNEWITVVEIFPWVALKPRHAKRSRSTVIHKKNIQKDSICGIESIMTAFWI